MSSVPWKLSSINLPYNMKWQWKTCTLKLLLYPLLNLYTADTQGYEQTAVINRLQKYRSTTNDNNFLISGRVYNQELKEWTVDVMCYLQEDGGRTWTKAQVEAPRKNHWLSSDHRNPSSLWNSSNSRRLTEHPIRELLKALFWLSKLNKLNNQLIVW